MTEPNSSASSKPKKAGGYSERRITQLKELKVLVWGLDLDEGLRFEIDFPGYESGAYMFLTKCDDRYCVSIKERILDADSGRHMPGNKEQWKYFETAEAAWNYISKYVRQPLEVYYY